MSAVAFAMCWLDTRRSGRGEWRIAEGTVHGIELLGGWPGPVDRPAESVLAGPR
jgi:uncharacterized membrane protein YsdA (DUF1294 family)